MKPDWPDLDAIALEPTLRTLHLWSQIPGKVRLALTPWENHSWHVSLYVSTRGLTTGPVPAPGGAVSLEFDFVAGVLRVTGSNGGEQAVALQPQSMSAFLRGVTEALAKLGVAVKIDPTPAELADLPRFDVDHAERGFDLDVARTYWQALVEVQRVFQSFRTRFVGKTSPIHLFWGAFDLAVTRFSGRTAPPHPGGIPRLSDAVAREAYCHEVSSAGFWPHLDGNDGPCFYSYAYPVPAAYDHAAVRPAAARYDTTLGEFLLPYRDVVASADPDSTLLDFLQTTYDAAADLGRWDRALLDRAPGRVGRPPDGS